MLNADRPLHAPDEDLLGHDAFARAIADGLKSLVSDDGLVVGLYGPWGSGKTTTANFVVRHLERQEETDKPIVVRFNPWWFSGEQDLLRRFFIQLRSSVSEFAESVAEAREFLADVGEALGNFGDALAEIPIPYLQQGAQVAQSLREGGGNPLKLKKKIEELLAGQDRRIFVVIDDVDRLETREIIQMFRLVKAIGDFPNVIYLVVFDYEVVVKALDNYQQGLRGSAYLEKIIQVPFELPPPDRTALNRMLFTGLDAVITDVPQDDFDVRYWANLYHKGLSHFVRSPRQIVRLLNALRVSFPSVEGEVNPVDFIAVEAIRLFVRPLYDIVRQHPKMFASAPEDAIGEDSRRDQVNNFHQAWLSEIDEDDRSAVKNLVQELFPKTQSAWSNIHFGSSSAADWRQQLRICSREIFPIYFRLALPTGTIGASTMRAIVDAAADREGLVQLMQDLAAPDVETGKGASMRILDRLTDYVDDRIPKEAIPNVIGALFELGDEYIATGEQTDGLFAIDNVFRISWVIRPLLQRLEPQERIDVLLQAAETGRAVSTIVDQTWSLGLGLGKYGRDSDEDEDSILTRDQHDRLEEAAVAAIERAKDRGELISAPNLNNVLWAWAEWGHAEAAAQWAQDSTADDVSLLTLLRAFRSRSVKQTMGDVMTRVDYRVNLDGLRKHVDLRALRERLQSIDQATLQEGDGEVVKAFLDALTASSELSSASTQSDKTN